MRSGTAPDGLGVKLANGEIKGLAGALRSNRVRTSVGSMTKRRVRQVDSIWS